VSQSKELETCRFRSPQLFQNRKVSLLAELKTHVEGKEAGSPAFAAARGGWLRGRVFRHGWFDEAAEIIGQHGLTPHEMRHAADQQSLGTDVAKTLPRSGRALRQAQGPRAHVDRLSDRR
jgi:hypothetical protein